MLRTIINMGNIVTYRKEFGLIVVGAIIFIASFLWKDMFTDIKEQYFPKQYGLTGRLLFTIIVTMLLIMLAVHLKHIWGLNGIDTSLSFDDNTLTQLTKLNPDLSEDKNNL